MKQSGTVARRSTPAWQIALASLIAIILLGLGARAPLSRDDLLSIERIRDVVDGGHWLLIHDEYPEHFRAMARDKYGAVSRKPPLFYWLSAIAVDLSGGAVNRFNVRAVPILAAAAAAVTTLLWTAAEIGPVQGWLAFLFLLGSYVFASRATAVLTDMLMTALLFAAWCIIYPLLDTPLRDKPSPGGHAPAGRLIVAGVLLGLAILTKGPIVLLICALGAAVCLAMLERNPLAPLRRPWPWAIFAISAGMAALWFVPAALAAGHDLVRVFIVENAGHFMPEGLGGIGESGRPVWFIAARMLGGTLPLSLLVAALMSALADGGFEARVRRPLFFQLGFLLAVLVIFSAGSGKRADYVLPAIPSLAILLAALFGSVAVSARSGRIAITLRNLVGVIVGVVTLVLLGITFLPMRTAALAPALRSVLTKSEEEYVQWTLARLERPDPVFALFVSGCLLGTIMIFVGLRRRRQFILGMGLGLVTLSMTTLWTGKVTPMRLTRQSLRDFVVAVHYRVGDAPLYLAPGYYDREIAFYYGRYLPLVDRTIKLPLEQGNSVYVVIEPARASKLSMQLKSNATELFRARDLIGHDEPALFRFEPKPSP